MDMGLFDHPQPGTVFLAAALGMTVGGITLVAAVVLGGTVPVTAVPWLVVGPQVVSAALLVVGGISLLLGTGRSALVAGAVLNLVLCAVHVWYIATEVPSLVAVPIGVTVVVAAGLALALSRVTSSYLGRGAPPTSG